MYTCICGVHMYHYLFLLLYSILYTVDKKIFYYISGTCNMCSTCKTVCTTHTRCACDLVHTFVKLSKTCMYLVWVV